MCKKSFSQTKLSTQEPVYEGIPTFQLHCYTERGVQEHSEFDSH